MNISSRRGAWGRENKLKGPFFFAQKEIPLRSNVTTAPSVIPEPRPGFLLRQVSHQTQWQEPLGEVVICRDN